MVYVPLPDEASRRSILEAQLRKSPVSPDVDLAAVARATNGFSGADLAFVVQRASKVAIKESIDADIKREQAAAAAGEDTTAAEEDVDMEDPVPEITRSHFEEAMAHARRSVSDADLRRYELFAQTLQQARGSFGTFKFPDAADGTAVNGSNGSFQQDDAAEDDLYS